MLGKNRDGQPDQIDFPLRGQLALSCWTGFASVAPHSDSGYLLLFRELNASDEWLVNLNIDRRGLPQSAKYVRRKDVFTHVYRPLIIFRQVGYFKPAERIRMRSLLE